MIKNVLLKKTIKGTVFPFISLINKIIPKDQSVVLLYTANKGICHSLIPLRKYLLDNKFDSKYKIYCGIEHLRYSENEYRVKFVAGIRAVFVFLKAGHVFYTAGQIPIKPSKGQLVFHLRHGNANFKIMKVFGDEFFFTHMIAPSDYYVPIMASEYGCSEKNILVAGDPLTDALLNNPKNSYNFSEYNKVLMWMPTFRQSDYYGYDDTKMEEIVPLFAEKDYKLLNDKLSSYNILLIVKVHGQQTVNDTITCSYSHLSIYTNDDFVKKGYDTYKLMAQCDGLVGDYSSASLQYLLLDRPQAYVIPDFEEYKANRSFAFENPEDYMGGHIIKTKNDFWTFLDDFAHNRDIYAGKRRWVCNQIYKYKDKHSCERIVKLNDMSID